jgi:hypothetical protein
MVGLDFAPHRCYKDKRIEDLRTLVCDATAGKVEFDDSFAKAILSEVFKCERKAGRFRNILSYVTLPLGFIPYVGTFAQKAVEETIARIRERKIKEKHRWFYLMSEVAGETTSEQISYALFEKSCSSPIPKNLNGNHRVDSCKVT